ncbi:MAG TPA: hypothetical protein VFW14_20895 [Gaiellales bacterium]|nr:hypothetical protein [Gaiellales bacterium]
MTGTLIWDGLENVRRPRDARTRVDYRDHAGRRPALPGRARGGRARWVAKAADERERAHRLVFAHAAALDRLRARLHA